MVDLVSISQIATFPSAYAPARTRCLRPLNQERLRQAEFVLMSSRSSLIPLCISVNTELDLALYIAHSSFSLLRYLRFGIENIRIDPSEQAAANKPNLGRYFSLLWLALHWSIPSQPEGHHFRHQIFPKSWASPIFSLGFEAISGFIVTVLFVVVRLQRFPKGLATQEV